MADTSEQDIFKMKVADLKKELKARGLNTVGNKNELIERLIAAMENDNSKIEINEELIDDVLNDEDEDLDEEIDEDVEDAEKVLDLETSVVSSENVSETSPIVTPSSKKEKRKARDDIVEDSNSKVPQKKIVLNRALSVNTSQNKTETVKDDQLETQKKSTLDQKNESINLTGEKKIIRLSNLTAKERLEMRAKKFGAPLTTEQKKEARSARFGSTNPISNTTGTAKISTNNDPKLDLLKKRAERFGTSVSSVMSKLDLQERLERRKARFGVNNTPLKKETTVK